MSTTKQIIEGFPLSALFFIFSAGLFMVLSFPYDIFIYDFSQGLKLPDLTIFDYLVNNFAPFVNVRHLSTDFVLGSAKILIVSFVVGVFFYLVSDLYRDINHRIAGGVIKRLLRNKFLFKKEIDILEKREGPVSSRYSKWLRDNELMKYTSFIWSIEMAAIGLFYASETLFVIVLFIAVPQVICSFSNAVYWLGWIGFTLGLGLFAYCLLRVYDIRYEKETAGLWRTFYAYEENEE